MASNIQTGKMRRVLMVAAALVGCTESDAAKPDDVISCELNATAACERIGYGGSRVCFLAFAQDCSQEDADAAHLECCTSMMLPQDAECRLTWR